MTDLIASALKRSKSMVIEDVEEAERAGAAVTEPAMVEPRKADPVDEKLEVKLELMRPAGAPVMPPVSGTAALTLFRARRLGKIQPSWQANADIAAAAAVRTVVLLLAAGSSRIGGVWRFVFKLGFGVARAAEPTTKGLATSGSSTAEVAKVARPMRRMRRLRASPETLLFAGPPRTGFEKHAILPSLLRLLCLV